MVLKAVVQPVLESCEGAHEVQLGLLRNSIPQADTVSLGNRDQHSDKERYNNDLNSKACCEWLDSKEGSVIISLETDIL